MNADDFDVNRLTPRPYQKEILDLAMGEKASDECLYVVCPPGAGKTILGLMLALRMHARTLVLAPNTAIQSQWIYKARLFEKEDGPAMASADPSDDAPVTALTYQALAQATDMSSEEKNEILLEWLLELTGEESEEPGNGVPEEHPADEMPKEEAEAWLAAFERENPERFGEAMLSRRKRRRLNAEDLGLMELTSSSACEIVTQLKQKGVSLVIFDECHHLVGFWAQVAAALKTELGAPRVLALTATPPSAEDLNNRRMELHKALLGEIDYALPTPAVVRDGNLAPYQDLVYFTRPTAQELTYLSSCTERLQSAMALVERPDYSKLSDWLQQTLDEIPRRHLPREMRRRARFLSQAVNYLRQRDIKIDGLLSSIPERNLSVDDRAELVGRFAVKVLLVGKSAKDRELFEELARAFRPLGFQITSVGARRCQSTVNRVLALSASKGDALRKILAAEIATKADVKAVVITDFEKSNATIDKRVEHLLTHESGGAIAVMRCLTSDPVTDELDPILLTGSTVLVDDDLLPRFLQEAEGWFKDQGLTVELNTCEEEGFFRVTGKGRHWSTRQYVMMITHFFEAGITRCLVGTRGLLGEGWDSLSLNTLIDLSTASTKMTVNQLRGRAIRLDPKAPKKMSNIWDVVCMAPELEQGLSDYSRLAKKHKGYHGLCDDGAIESGLSHLHPALDEAGPEDVALNAHIFNAEMLQRAGRRSEAYEAWKVGTPYRNCEAPTLELKDDALFGPYIVKDNEAFALETSEMLLNICRAIDGAMRQLALYEGSDASFTVSQRSDGYYRLALNSSSAIDMTNFTESVAQLFEPITDQRYIIPRHEERRIQNWFSKMLPELLNKYFCKRERFIAVYHPVPAIFASKKDRANCFSDHWNQHVSEGRALFALRGKGKETASQARNGGQTVPEVSAKVRSVWC